MKLFDNYEAVRFPEEKMILITSHGCICYVYKAKYDSWTKPWNAGNTSITTANYPNVTKEELVRAMHGVFPQKETDFLRQLKPAQLNIGNMLDLLREDYTEYMEDPAINHVVDNLFEK